MEEKSKVSGEKSPLLNVSATSPINHRLFFITRFYNYGLCNFDVNAKVAKIFLLLFVDLKKHKKERAEDILMICLGSFLFFATSDSAKKIPYDFSHYWPFIFFSFFFSLPPSSSFVFKPNINFIQLLTTLKQLYRQQYHAVQKKKKKCCACLFGEICRYKATKSSKKRSFFQRKKCLKTVKQFMRQFTKGKTKKNESGGMGK